MTPKEIAEFAAETYREVGLQVWKPRTGPLRCFSACETFELTKIALAARLEGQYPVPLFDYSQD